MLKIKKAVIWNLDWFFYSNLALLQELVWFLETWVLSHMILSKTKLYLLQQKSAHFCLLSHGSWKKLNLTLISAIKSCRSFLGIESWVQSCDHRGRIPSSMAVTTDNGHSERAFFQKFESFGLGQTNWAEVLGCILVNSSQTIRDLPKVHF